jgi:hypothetical protein
MKHWVGMVAFGVVAFGMVALSGADEKKGTEKKVLKAEVKIKKGPKADVEVTAIAKSATAKAGQVVQMSFGRPLSPPFPTDYVVKVNGKKVESKVYEGEFFLNGKASSAKADAVQFKAEGEGKQKVVIEYKQGTQQYRQAFELEVTK